LIPALLSLGLLSALCGCFSERAIPYRAGDFRPIAAEPVDGADARAWLESAGRGLEPLLPPEPQPPLTTSMLTADDGEVVDVLRYFGRRPQDLPSVFRNYYGLLHTAQTAGADSDPKAPPPMWPEFEQVWIPVADGVTLSGRLALATRPDGAGVADCIVLIPGLFGDNGVVRTREIARALRSHGLHVLALEQRGSGLTEAKQPEVAYTFGALEARDLLRVAEWLEARPDVRRTGLIGYCWGANVALLVAWENARRADDPDVAPPIRAALPPPCGHTHFQAGILVYSPVVRFERTIAEMNQAWSFWLDPVRATLQAEIAARQAAKGHSGAVGSLRALIDAEYERSVLSYPGSVEDALRYLRFVPEPGLPAGPKLETARVPLLIVHASNDPLAPAQDVADLVAGVRNPNVAALILRGGGHVGFAAYAREYFYSLMLNFFDPVLGAAAAGDQIR